VVYYCYLNRNAHLTDDRARPKGGKSLASCIRVTVRFESLTGYDRYFSYLPSLILRECQKFPDSDHNQSFAHHFQFMKPFSLYNSNYVWTYDVYENWIIAISFVTSLQWKRISPDWGLDYQGTRLRFKCDDTRAETRFRLSAKWTSPFKSAGASVQSTTGSRGMRFSGNNAGYTMFRCGVKSTSKPLHSPVSPSLPPPVSPCATTFQLDSTTSLHRASCTTANTNEQQCECML